MGTNYYAIVEPCKECGHPKQRLHIGKSSFGWDFLFREHGVFEDRGEIKTYDDWCMKLNKENVTIIDEYDKEVSLHDFFAMVYNKKQHGKQTAREDRHVRADIDGYSFCNREFS